MSPPDVKPHVRIRRVQVPRVGWAPGAQLPPHWAGGKSEKAPEHHLWVRRSVTCAGRGLERRGFSQLIP